MIPCQSFGLYKKERSDCFVLFLERITGDEPKTVDNCFWRRKSTKQGVLRAETCEGEERQLCDSTELEPRGCGTAMAGERPYPLLVFNFKKTKTLAKRKCLLFFGADYGARTRHLHLGKVALYQMS